MAVKATNDPRGTRHTAMAFLRAPGLEKRRASLATVSFFKFDQGLVLGADFFLLFFSLLCWLLEARTLSLVRTVGRVSPRFCLLVILLAFPPQMLLDIVLVAVVLGVVRVALRS